MRPRLGVRAASSLGSSLLSWRSFSERFPGGGFFGLPVDALNAQTRPRGGFAGWGEPPVGVLAPRCPRALQRSSRWRERGRREGELETQVQSPRSAKSLEKNLSPISLF